MGAEWRHRELSVGGHSVQCSAVLCSAVQCRQYSAVQCSAPQAVVAGLLAAVQAAVLLLGELHRAEPYIGREARGLAGAPVCRETGWPWLVRSHPPSTVPHTPGSRFHGNRELGSQTLSPPYRPSQTLQAT